MKNTFFALACITLLFSCNTKTEITKTTTDTVADVDTTAIRSQIEAMETRFAKGLADRNIDSIMVYYADNAQSYENGQAPMIGKQQIRDQISKQLATMVKGMSIDFDTKDVQISNDGSQVSETGSFVVLDSAKTQVVDGNFLAVFEKSGDKYQCVREMIITNEPAKK